MGSDWDFFGNKSWINYDSITDIQKNNRNYLQSIMNENGFKSYSKEWWSCECEGCCASKTDLPIVRPIINQYY